MLSKLKILICKIKMHLMVIMMKRILATKHRMKMLIPMKKITLRINLKTIEVFTDSKDIAFKKSSNPDK